MAPPTSKTAHNAQNLRAAARGLAQHVSNAPPPAQPRTPPALAPSPLAPAGARTATHSQSHQNAQPRPRSPAPHLTSQSEVRIRVDELRQGRGGRLQAGAGGARGRAPACGVEGAARGPTSRTFGIRHRHRGRPKADAAGPALGQRRQMQFSAACRITTLSRLPGYILEISILAGSPFRRYTSALGGDGDSSRFTALKSQLLGNYHGLSSRRQRRR